MTRLASLDAARGLAVLSMIAVNTAAYVYYANDFPVFPFLLHAHWQGFTYADWVFPAFVFITGASIAAAHAASQEGQPSLARAFWRAARLFALGVVLSNLYWMADFESVPFRPFGVLQRLALVAFACSAAVVFLGPKARLAIAAALLALYWPLCLAPVPDGVATTLEEPGMNIVAWVDRTLLGQHTYVRGEFGYDPEGIVSTLPAIAQGLLGVAAGEFALRRRGDGKAFVAMALIGAAMTLSGVLWGLAFPIVKDIWSSSFVLVSSGLTLIVFALMQAWLDRGAGRTAPLLTAFGLNAITAYTLHMLASIVLGGDLFRLPYAILVEFLPAEIASLAPIALFILLMWTPVAYMMRRGWVVKI